MKRKILLIFISLILSFNVLVLPAFSQTESNCDRHEESVAFQIPSYKIQHQGEAVLNIKVAYRITPDAIEQKDYPDFMPMKNDIDRFFVNYPNETDYWEIVNNNLSKFILDKYPQISSLSIELDVMPTSQEPFPHSSIVKSTRPQGCYLTI